MHSASPTHHQAVGGREAIPRDGTILWAGYVLHSSYENSMASRAGAIGQMRHSVRWMEVRPVSRQGQVHLLFYHNQVDAVLLDSFSWEDSDTDSFMMELSQHVMIFGEPSIRGGRFRDTEVRKLKFVSFRTAGEAE